MVDGAGAAAWEGAGIAADEGEGTIGMGAGEVLGADGEDAVEIGEVEEGEVSKFAGGQGFAGFGVDDESAAPVRKAVAALTPGGVGLGGEFGHAVFVMNVAVGDLEMRRELAVEVGLFEGAVGAFIAAGFHELGAWWERQGAGGLDEMEEGQSGSDEEEGLVLGECREERGEVKAGVFEEEALVGAVIQGGQHVAERGMWCLDRRGSEEVGGERLVRPGRLDGGFVEGGVRKMVGPASLAGGAGGEEGGFSGLAAGEGEVGVFKGIGGESGDFLPGIDGFRSGAESLAVVLIGEIFGKLMGEELAREVVEGFAVGIRDEG